MLVEIGLKITLDTAFNISTGAMADSTADKPLLKDAARRPIIPGSSIKGLIRHECERISRALIGEKWVWDCQPPNPDAMCKTDERRSNWREQICPVCRIFGAPWHPSRLTFENLTLVPGRGDAPRDWQQLSSLRKTDLRPGVGISRKRGISEEKLLYTTETYLSPNMLEYEGKIWGTLAERPEVALLIAGLRSVIAFGSNRSRGLGWGQIGLEVRLDDERVEENVLLQELRQWLN